MENQPVDSVFVPGRAGMREGSGMPPWDASQLENEFFQGKSMHWTALGLPALKQIVITVCIKMLETYHTLYFIFEILLFTLSEEEAVMLFIVLLYVYLFIFERQSESREGAERARERENPKQAVCWQDRAHCGAQSHKPWDHDLSQNQEWDAQPTEPPRCTCYLLLTQILKNLIFEYNLNKYAQTKADKSVEWE